MIRRTVVLIAACITAHSSAQTLDNLIPRAQGRPGCSIAVLRADGAVEQRAFGLADVELGVPITADTVFLAGSIAKQFTAASALLLVQDGKLSLDDDVRKYVSELPRVDPPITIRDLMGHTSGLKDDMELLKVAGFHTWDDAIGENDVMRAVVSQRTTNFPAGSEFLYSDTNYDLLAIVIRRVSGKSLRTFADERIFQPLGMRHTLFRDDHRELVAGRAQGYVDENGVLRIAMPRTSQLGAANLFTTPGDLLLWVRNLEKAAVGGPQLIAGLLREARLRNGSPTGYAGGLELKSYRGHRLIEHDGAQAGYVGDVFYLPDDHFGVAVLCNLRQNPRRLPRQIADLFLPMPAQRKEGPPISSLPIPAHDRAGIPGIYRSLRDGSYNIVRFDHGRFVVTDSDGDAFGLIRRGDAIYGVEGQGEDVAFRFLPERLVRTIGVRISSFQRVSPPLKSVSRFTGDYRNTDLGVTWTFIARGADLVLRRPRFEDEMLKPVFAGGFQSDQWFLEFRGDDLFVRNERLRSVTFHRTQYRQRPPRSSMR